MIMLCHNVIVVYCLFFFVVVVFFFFFFFSSRRRHTRSYGDWSSDVCSSDLFVVLYVHSLPAKDLRTRPWGRRGARRRRDRRSIGEAIPAHVFVLKRDSLDRSEERRVGKECRCRWWAYS